jgi:hypothetical protein
MVSRVHFEQNGTIKHTFSADNLDILGWKSWKASSERQVRQPGFFGDSWNRVGGSRDFTAIFVRPDGTQFLPNPPRRTETGYQYEEWSGFGIGPPAWGVEGLVVNYEFGGELFSLEEGRNWITFVATLILLIAVVAVLVFVFGLSPRGEF